MVIFIFITVIVKLKTLNLIAPLLVKQNKKKKKSLNLFFFVIYL